MKRHAKVPFGYKYDFDNKRCIPLTEDSTPEEKLHQYVGVWIEEEDDKS